MRLAVGTTSVLSQVQGESTENYAINSFINTIHVLKKLTWIWNVKITS